MLIIMVFRDPTALICLVEQRVTGFVKFLIIYGVRRIPKIKAFALLLVQNTLFDERIQTDKIRISGKS